jgi:hypothetical protein
MDFNQETSSLMPDLVKDTQKEKKMFDLNVIKKGLNYHGMTKNDLENEAAVIKNEEERIEREKAVMNKTSRSYNTKDDKS